MATLELDSVAGDYEDVRVIQGPRSGFTRAVAIHRTVEGRSLGGCRMWAYASPDDAVADVERLARSMTFKAAAAGLRIGGGKGVIALPVGAGGAGIGKSRRRDALHDFAELVESFGGRYVTAQDVGVSLDDMTYVSRYTQPVAGHPVEDGGAGDPSPYTAHGVEIAIRATLGGQPLDGKRIVV